MDVFNNISIISWTVHSRHFKLGGELFEVGGYC